VPQYHPCMELSPHVIANATFPVVKRGYDPDGVRAFLADAARAYEGAAQHASAMENRARAAVAKVHELQNAAKNQSELSKDDADTIGRTLLLAQKAADATVAEARSEADALLSNAHAESHRMLVEAEAESDRLLNEARYDVRRQVEAERLAAQGEVQELLARRDFLVSDVEALERHVADQRRRLLDIASLLSDIADQGPGGLGDVRRPLLSAAGEDTAAHPLIATEPSTDDFWSEAEPGDAAPIVLDDVEAPDLLDFDGLDPGPVAWGESS
jgi:DivIVA domain-containing protein